MPRKLSVTLSDQRALDIVDSIPKDRLDDQVEKLIIVGHMVLSHASIITSEGAAEAFFAPLSQDIDRLQEQLNRIVPTISKAAKKGALAEEGIFESYCESFMDDQFENVSKRGKFTDILARPRGSSHEVLVEIKNYSGTVPSDQVSKFWRDMEERGAKYGIFVSTETGITKIPSDVHMETKADMTALFVVNSNLGYVGHLLAYKIVRRMIEHELSFAELGEDDLHKVNQTLRRIKSDIQILDEIRVSAKDLRDSSMESLTKIAENASLLRQRLDERIEELIEQLA